MRNKKSKHICLSCGAADWHENREFSALPRVASDSTPFVAGGRICVCLQCGLIQKVTDACWKSEIDGIYRDYKMYELTGGADQVLFGEGGVTRAEKIADILAQHIPESFSGNAIDIGCGTGGFLRAFGGKCPNAALYGQEIDDKNLHYLEKIANFKALFTTEAPSRGRCFDVIVSIHCFEHIYNYANYFNEINGIRTDSTRILLQVPDIGTSLFDIVIADHAAHFSQASLQDCLDRYLPGFAVSKPIHKELTAIFPAQRAGTPPAADAEKLTQALDARVNYLTRLLAHIDGQHLDEFGVYGTTIAGAWLTAAYADKIAFYVDDDVLKHGKTFQGKKVISAEQVPANGRVVMPFGAAAIQSILRRHPHLTPQAVFYNP